MTTHDAATDVMLFGGGSATLTALLFSWPALVAIVTVIVTIIGLIAKLYYYWKADQRAEALFKAQQEALCDTRHMGRDEAP